VAQIVIVIITAVPCIAVMHICNNFGFIKATMSTNNDSAVVKKNLPAFCAFFMSQKSSPVASGIKFLEIIWVLNSVNYTPENPEP
jgi:hypothetical protein